jgi:hypothetical protein
MAKVRKNMIVSGLSGTLDDNHYARVTRDGRTIISLKPDFSNRQFSEVQLEHQSRVKQAAAYAKVASKTNPIYALKAKDTSRNAYNLAFKDWFNAPVIHSVDVNRDGKIRVGARDDMLVTRVMITILDEAGQLLEQGEAELTMAVWWDYQSQNRGRVRVEAWDMAGNVAQRELDNPWKFTPGAKKTK